MLGNLKLHSVTVLDLKKLGGGGQTWEKPK